MANKTNRTIEWEVWENPLKSLLQQNDADLDDDELSYEDKVERDSMGPSVVDGKHYIFSPFGIIPAPESQKLNQDFQLVIGHTNFVLTDEYINAIENVLGVEIVYPFSSYRILVGIAKHSDFKAANVKFNIQKVIAGETLQENPELQIEDIAHQIEDDIHKTVQKMKKGKFLYWFVFALPNGNIISGSADTEDKKYFGRLETVKELNRAVKGRLITNDD